jgi:hypothetical protein
MELLATGKKIMLRLPDNIADVLFVLRLFYISCVFFVVVSVVECSEHLHSFTEDGIKYVTELTIPNTFCV